MQSKLFQLVSLRKLEQILGYKRSQILEIADNVGARYTTRAEPKSNGKPRKIDNPNPELKALQKRIKTNLFGDYLFPSSMKGGVKGESTRRNAKVHVGQPEILKMDLKNCFPKTTNRMVFEQLRAVFNCSTEIASIITRLTTVQRMVPQGAPTSSFVTNLALLPLHDDIARFCKEREWNFTLWVDDITISGKGLKAGIQGIIDLTHKHGYTVKLAKVEIIRSGNRQEVTGQVVNKKVSVSKDKLEGIRKEILELKSQQEIPSYVFQSLKGKINYVRMSSPSKALRLSRLLTGVTLNAIIKEQKKPWVVKRQVEIKSPHKMWPRIRKPRTSSIETT